MIRTSFAAAHCLKHYQGDCENLHGHNWKVEVAVIARELDKAGLGIDFKILKADTKVFLKTLDHKYLNELPAFSQQNPSSENLAFFLYQRLTTVLNRDGVKVSRVSVWESDTSRALFRRSAK